MKIKYIGQTHRRVIRPQDMERQNIPSLKKNVTWEKDGEAQEVPDDVGNWLTKNLKDEFSSEGSTSSTRSSGANEKSS